VLLLAVGYLFMNYAFYLLSSWVFLYLVQERHFSILEGGWLASAPPLAAAAGAGVGGWLTSALCRRVGDRWGLRLVPLVALPSAAVLLLLSVATPDPYVAVIALAACFGSLELCEAAFWSGAMTIGRRDTMAVSAMMNTGGVIGGVVGIPVVAYLSANQMWSIAFAIGAAFSMLSAIAWLGIDAGSPAVDSSVSDDAMARPEGVLG
jgi:ACS family glucarate transporter-like MFS transporter